MVRPIFILVSVAGFFFSLYLAEVQGLLKRTPQSVGRIEYASSPLRRLIQEHFTWDRTGTGSAVYSGDTLSAGETTSARVLLARGGELSLWPGSMVVLREDPKELNLNFVMGAGDLKFDQTSRGKIKLTLAKMSDKQARRTAAFAVIQEQSIRKIDQAVETYGKILTTQALPPVPILIYPSQDTVLKTDEKSGAHLNWMLPVPGDFSYEVTLKSTVPNAKAQIYRVAKPHLEINNLLSGTYQWSVRAVDSLGKRGAGATPRWLQWVAQSRSPARVKAKKKLGKAVLLPPEVNDEE